MSVRTWQGTTQVNNLVVNGNFTANDLKYIQTFVGEMSAQKRFEEDTKDPVNDPDLFPDITMSGYMRQKAIKTSMVLEYRVAKGDTSEFTPVSPTMNITVAGDLPYVSLTTQAYIVCAKAKIENIPLGNTLLGDPLSPDLLPANITFFEGQNVFVILRKGTDTDTYKIAIYYEQMQYPIALDPVQYGWQADNVLKADLLAVFDFFIGAEVGGITQLLDAGSFFRLSATSAL